jgi:uncharacterized membrane protein YcjF (UPF0283 family)
MQMPHINSHRRARCSANRTLRSGAVALALVALPELSTFIKHGTFTRAALFEFLQSFIVAALMVAFNYLQRLHEEERRITRRRRRSHERADADDTHDSKPAKE